MPFSDQLIAGRFIIISVQHHDLGNRDAKFKFDAKSCNVGFKRLIDKVLIRDCALLLPGGRFAYTPEYVR